MNGCLEKWRTGMVVSGFLVLQWRTGLDNRQRHQASCIGHDRMPLYRIIFRVNRLRTDFEINLSFAGRRHRKHYLLLVEVERGHSAANCAVGTTVREQHIGLFRTRSADVRISL